MFTLVGHTVKRRTPRNGAAVWVEDVKASEFTVCVLEFSSGSNKSIEVNYLAFETKLHGSQTGTTSLNSWTTGAKCKRIDFQQVRINFVEVLMKKEALIVDVDARKKKNKTKYIYRQLALKMMITIFEFLCV